jgi:hypothetical protein
MDAIDPQTLPFARASGTFLALWGTQSSIDPNEWKV